LPKRVIAASLPAIAYPCRGTNDLEYLYACFDIVFVVMQLMALHAGRCALQGHARYRLEILIGLLL
jgi:hypothetical protein